MRDNLTIATRGSKLALWQAEHIKSLLTGRYPDLKVDLAVIKTQGDIIQDVALAKIGGKGLFVKEIEEALMDGRADLAVHSMKDVPAELPEGLSIAVTPEREIPFDSLLSVHYQGLGELPRGAVVGTASLRRQAQLLIQRPDLEIRMLRGNVDTRLRKLMEGQFDAIVMASAGLKRLGLAAPKTAQLAPPDFLPAVAQGALGIELRDDDAELAEMLAFIDHPDSRTRVMAERGFLTTLEGGCQVPIAGFAELSGDTLTLTGLVCDETGTRVIRRQTSGPRDAAWDMGCDLAREVLAAGADTILKEIYAKG